VGLKPVILVVKMIDGYNLNLLSIKIKYY